MSRRPSPGTATVNQSTQRGVLLSEPNLPAEEQVARPITLLDKWRFVKQAIPNKRLAAGDLRCLFAITDCYNSSKGRAWPSYSYISVQTGLSRSAIARSVGRLHALGIIHKVSGGTGRANTYRPAFRESLTEIASPETGITDETGTDYATSATEETTPVSPTIPDPSHTCDTKPLTPRSNSVGEYRGIPAAGGAALAGGSLRPPGGGPGIDGFEEFWSSYPKREGRALAKLAYSRVIATGISPHTLVVKARQYAEAKADIDAKWLKMPANWLKEECWREDPQPPRPREPKPARAGKAVVGRQKPAGAKSKQQAPLAKTAVPMVKSADGVGRLALTRSAKALKREAKWVGSIPEFIRPGAPVFHAGRNQHARVVSYGTKGLVRIECEPDGARKQVHYRELSPAPPPPPIAEASKLTPKPEPVAPPPAQVPHATGPVADGVSADFA